MILIDLNQVCIANILQEIKQLKKIEVSEIYDWFRDQIKKHGKTLAAMGGGAGIAVMMGAV